VLAAAAASGVLCAPCGAAGADATGASSGGGSVSVGASSGSGTPGAPGAGGAGAGAGPSSGGGSWTCTSTYLALNNEGGMPAGGPQPGAWYSVTCTDGRSGVQSTQTVWITSGAPTPVPAVDPRAVALRAERSLALPAPVLRTDPGATSVVNLDTWLWIDPALWHVYVVTATAGPVSATAVARPVAVRWTTGDGAVVTCAGPGTPFLPWLPAASQTTGCAHRYLRSSAGQGSPGGSDDRSAFPVTATVEWAARRGLLVSPYDERLYRMLLRAADLAGNPAGVEAVMAELVRVVADEADPLASVHPSTLALYRSLSRRPVTGAAG